jgi:hypothetical protein
LLEVDEESGNGNRKTGHPEEALGETQKIDRLHKLHDHCLDLLVPLSNVKLDRVHPNVKLDLLVPLYGKHIPIREFVCLFVCLFVNHHQSINNKYSFEKKMYTILILTEYL